MKFKRPELKDKPILDQYFQHSKTKSCDYATANIILWNHFYNVEYAIVEDMLVFKSEEYGKVAYSYPVGNGDEKKTIEALMKDCKARKLPFVLYGITKEMEAKLIEMFGDIFDITYDRDKADYIYLTESLATLRGKKLHGKRNHINRFKEQHEWSYESLTDENALEAMTMLMQWKLQNCEPDDIEKHEEICVSKNALMYYKELGLVGGILRAEGKIIAFSIGEPISDTTFVVHIEKAFSEIQGAYPMINQQFVQHEAMDYEFINREEDLGEEGLRKAKLSYRPHELLEKGVLTLR